MAALHVQLPCSIVSLQQRAANALHVRGTESHGQEKNENMIKFKRFKGFKHKTTDIDNVNVQDGGAPQATVGATASIGESFGQEKVHYNPSIGTMKNIAKNSPSKTTRFNIDPEGQWTAGDAFHHTHSQMSDEISTSGFIHHHSDDDSYTYHVDPASHHQTIDRLHKFNIHKSDITPKEADNMTMGEQLATACQTPNTQYSIGINDTGVTAQAQLPFKLKLSKKQADELEKNIENSLELILKPYFVKESGEDQMLVVRTKPTKSFMKKATNVSPQTDKHPIGTIVSGDGTIGLSEEYDYPEGLHEKLANHYNYTPEHHETMKDYTDDSRDINEHLWNKGSDSHLNHKVNKIDEVMKAHKTPHAMTVYSGVEHDPGETAHHPAYISTSLDHEVAKGFANGSRGGAKHILAIHVPEGHSGAYVGHTSHVPAEREFVMPHGLNLKRSHVDTQMGYSRIYKRPQPIHTHHMVPNED